ncbi:MAG: hypothetical protein QM747_14495 [Nocardioides sp.]
MRVRRAVTAVVLAASCCGGLTACGSHHEGDEAVWELAGTDGLTQTSQVFTAIVTRVGCSGGMQGHPVKPVIEPGKASIVITFRIAPHFSGAADCQGTPGVPYTVRLPEPLGDRTLVDGDCRSGTIDIGDCRAGGVRLRWRGGEPQIPGQR